MQAVRWHRLPICIRLLQSSLIPTRAALSLRAEQHGVEPWNGAAFEPIMLSTAMQGQYQTAISHLKRVLEISKEMGDHVGDADAYGVIADIYTDLNDFDQAAIYYDKYIETMTTEGSVV